METTIVLPLPLTEDGTIRMTGTRVSLDSVVHEYEQGATPEEIAISFASLRIEDIYAAITYYLNHREQVEEYLRHQEMDAEEVHRRIESVPDYQQKMQDLCCCTASDRSTPILPTPVLQKQLPEDRWLSHSPGFRPADRSR
ncbi:MAG: DUF433 domain-containing protein [Acidobacteriota bacterium]